MFLYFDRVVEPNMVATINIISADQSNTIQSTTNKVVKLLNYEATQL